MKVYVYSLILSINLLSITLKFTKARESTCRKSWETCCRKDTHCDKPFETIPRPIECGRRNQETISEQLSGLSGTRQESTFRKWSHMCIILQNWIQDGKPTPYYKCGASLIAPDIVLTAAHCVGYVIKRRIVENCVKRYSSILW